MASIAFPGVGVLFWASFAASAISAGASCVNKDWVGCAVGVASVGLAGAAGVKMVQGGAKIARGDKLIKGNTGPRVKVNPKTRYDVHRSQAKGRAIQTKGDPYAVASMYLGAGAVVRDRAR